MSLAAKPSSSTTPGLAIKLFVDGQDSYNFPAMFSLDGQESYNFFENPFSNFVEDPSSTVLKILAEVFKAASKNPMKISVDHLNRTAQDGLLVPLQSRRGPEQLLLKPNPDLSFASTPHEIRDDFSKIPSGTMLYEVYGREFNKGEYVFIGRIESTSRFIASQYGDERLFFNHQRYRGE